LTSLVFAGCSFGKYGYISEGKVFLDNWQDEKSVGYFLAEMLDLNFINLSEPGGANFKIFDSILKSFKKNEIRKTDVLFIQWTYVARAWLHDHPNIGTIMPHINKKLVHEYYKYIFNDCQEANKIFGYTMILQQLFNTVLYNFCDGEKFINKVSPETFSILSNNNYINANSDIFSIMFGDEYHFSCKHLNENGHRKLANIYYKIIKNRQLL
jgi:hypothetical protein